MNNFLAYFEFEQLHEGGTDTVRHPVGVPDSDGTCAISGRTEMLVRHVISICKLKVLLNVIHKPTITSSVIIHIAIGNHGESDRR